jgi:hypothetical protein
MRLKIFLFFSAFGLMSCSIFDPLRKESFSFNANRKQQSFDILVPKGYHKSESKRDSLGNHEQFYYYRNAVLYFAFLTDSGKQYQSIDTAYHIPLTHPAGGLIYKAQDSTKLFWREIRLYNGLRFGYKHVSGEVEGRFDSALNYAGKGRLN